MVWCREIWGFSFFLKSVVLFLVLRIDKEYCRVDYVGGVEVGYGYGSGYFGCWRFVGVVGGVSGVMFVVGLLFFFCF